ncbi:MAG: hypothetical protein HRU75_09350 [Planctomycetia bacterium]|nr:MAG: hypothetical protein HRU75_09350 [Planctomycetia bacterium]
MKHFHVTVAVKILEVYKVEATDPADASDRWFEGALIHTSDEALETDVLSVKEHRHD